MALCSSNKCPAPGTRCALVACAGVKTNHRPYQSLKSCSIAHMYYMAMLAKPSPAVKAEGANRSRGQTTVKRTCCQRSGFLLTFKTNRLYLTERTARTEHEGHHNGTGIRVYQSPPPIISNHKPVG